MTDRDYHFWMATFDCAEGGIGPVPAVEAMLEQIRGEAPQFSSVGYEIYADVGSVEFETTGQCGRNWRYFVIAELAETVSIEALVQANPAALRRARWGDGITCLSSELTVRPAGAGTCVPRARHSAPVMPPHFKIGIEYIHVPREHWTDYQEFMRTVYGPIGRRLVDDGHFHKIVITEGVHCFHRGDGMPDWNCIHLSSADFDDESNGALARVEAAVRAHLGEDQTIATSMDPVRAYRTKPKMSKNALVHSTWRNVA